MISIEEVNGEIEKLLNQPASYAQIERLAWLYIVQDHLAPGQEIPAGDSAFRKICGGKPVCDIMAVMDDLMDSLLIVQPRLYDAVMAKIS